MCFGLPVARLEARLPRINTSQLDWDARFGLASVGSHALVERMIRDCIEIGQANQGLELDNPGGFGLDP